VEYTYQVSAFNMHGESTRSGNATASVYTVPGVPTGLRGDLSDGVADLSWEAPSSDGGAAIDYYVVYLNGVESQVVYGSTSAEVAGLSLGVNYIFTVRAHNEAGLGGESDSITLIERTTPSSPNLKAAWGDGRVDLTWSTPYNGGSPITGYILYKQWPGLSNWTQLASLKGNSYSDVDLINGQTYAYKVRAVNGIGEGRMSNVVKDFPRTLPGAPELYVLEPGSNSLFAEWADPDDDGGAPIEGYHVYVDGVLYATTSAQNITISGLEVGITYSVTIKAYTLAGVGPASDPMTATPVSAPGPITDLQAISQPNKVVLAWDAPQTTGGAGPVQYRVYQRVQDATGFTLITVTSGTEMELAMTMADIGKARDYRVEAFNSVGTGGNMTVTAVMPNVVYISGMVLDEEGAPIPGALVSASSGGQVITGADGSFRIQVDPGTVVLNITAEGREPAVQEVLVGASPVEAGTVTMSPTEEQTSNEGIDPIWVLVPVVIIVGGVAALVLVRRKK
jgi:titin